jgi:hypothetical protein
LCVGSSSSSDRLGFYWSQQAALNLNRSFFRTTLSSSVANALRAFSFSPVDRRLRCKTTYAACRQDRVFSDRRNTDKLYPRT